MWLSFVATFAFVGMESTFALFGERRFDYDAVQMGLLFTYIGVLAAFGQGVLVGGWSRRWGESRVMIAGLVGTAVGLAVVAVAHDLWVLLVGLALLAVRLRAGVRHHHGPHLPGGGRPRAGRRARPQRVGRERRPHRRAARGVAAVPARGHRGAAGRRGGAVRGVRGGRDTGQDQSVASRGGVTRVCITTQ